jgi:uncharacterized HAD superfamily protein
MASSNKVVMFDIDGVLADFVGAYTALAHEYYGTPIYTSLEQASWDFKQLGLTNAQKNFLWEKIKSSESWWTSLAPLLHRDTYIDIDGLQMEADIYFVTSRPGVNVRWQTKQWLQAQGIYSPSVILSSRKGDVATGLQADFMIDDKAGNAIFVKYQSPKTRVFILDREYNQFNPGVIGSKVERIKSVEDFIKEIR